MTMTAQRIRILEAVHQYGVLSRDQIGVLAGYASTNTVNYALGQLFHGGFLVRHFVAPVVVDGTGDHQALYQLDRAGAELLAARRGLDDWRHLGWKPRENGISWWHLHHRIDCNEILIRLTQAAAAARCRVQWLPEKELRRPQHQAKVEVQVPGGRRTRTAVVADALVELTPRRGQKLVFFIECDRSTMDIAKRWTTKVLAYTAFLQSDLYPQCFPFGRHTVGVLTVTTGGPQRLAHLKQAAEAASQASFFLFATMADVATADPIRGLIWGMAHASGRHALVSP